jgi:hypothetical protein
LPGYVAVTVSVPTGSVDVDRVAVVTAVAPEPDVDRVPVPSVTPPLLNVTVPVAGDEAPATVGTVKVSATGEPYVEVVGLSVSVSPVLATAPTGSVVVEEIAPKLPPAGAVAVTVSEPTGSTVVVTVAVQVVGLAAGVPVKGDVPRVTPPLAKVADEVGQTPLIGVTVSVRTTGDPYVSPVAGEAARLAVAVAWLTVSVAVGLAAA